MEYTDNTTGSSTDPDAAALSWQENELVGALKRLANAKSQLATLEAEDRDGRQLAHGRARRCRGPHGEPGRARGRPWPSRAPASAVRRLATRRPQLEANERLILGRMGLITYDEFEAWRAGPPTPRRVDPAVLDFARREVARRHRRLAADPVTRDPRRGRRARRGRRSGRAPVESPRRSPRSVVSRSTGGGVNLSSRASQ